MWAQKETVCAIGQTDKRIVREFPLMYRQSTDSIWLFAERSLHSRMLVASPQEYVYIERSHRFRMPRLRSDVNVSIWTVGQPRLSGKCIGNRTDILDYQPDDI